MKLKVFFLLFLFSLKAFSARNETEKPLPTGPVLSIKDQEALFVKAYSAVGPETIHPAKTSIPGLKPLIENFYRYTHELVQGSPSHVALLKEFWQKTSRIIDDNKITVEQMKAIAMQLAFLLTHLQKPNLFQENERPEDLSIYGYYYGDLFKGGLWKNLDHYPEQKTSYFGMTFDQIAGSGLCCEAILCCKSGGFSFERFAKAYLAGSFPMHLSALSYVGEDQGPHGGSYDDPLDFLRHDFGHAAEFITGFLSDGSIPQPQRRADGTALWGQARDLLTKIYTRTNLSDVEKKANMAGLFWLVHETYTPLIISAMEESAGKGDGEIFERLIKGKLIKKLPEPNCSSSFSEEYKTFFLDYERILRSLYGDASFPEDVDIGTKVRAVLEGKNRFWTEFYERNKGLFSAEPITQ